MVVWGNAIPVGRLGGIGLMVTDTMHCGECLASLNGPRKPTMQQWEDVAKMRILCPWVLRGLLS